MTVKKDLTTEWSTPDNIVFGKPQTYNKIRRIAPKIQYGKSPKGYGDNYYIEDRGNREFVVIQEFSGYTSLTGGHKPSRKDVMVRGTLRECKNWLVNLLNKCYVEQNKESL